MSNSRVICNIMLHNHTLALFLRGIPKENSSHIASRQDMCVQSGFKDVKFTDIQNNTLHASVK